MKRHIALFTIIFFSFIKGYSQAYVKFNEEPSKYLKTTQLSFNHKIEYKAIKKSTIYLELKKGDLLIGNTVFEIKKPNKKTVSINLSVFNTIKKLPLGNDYSYNLYMYEGGRNDWSKKACETLTVKGIQVK